MRLPLDPEHDDAVAIDTIVSAAGAGITVFDTAHAYGPDDSALGQNERLLARALRRCGADRRARIITKGGMTRSGAGWLPDGRAKTIVSGCEASLAALDGLPIDLFLIHAPDPRTPWRTSLRALGRLLQDGAVAHVGLSNVNRRQVEEAVDLVEVTAVEVALSVFDDTAVRGGLVDFCAEQGIAVIAHSPLGGPRRAASLARRSVLTQIARAREMTPEEVALAWLLNLSPVIVAIPGARRPETARSAARAAQLHLDSEDRRLLAGGFAWMQQPHPDPSPLPLGEGEIVMVMGIPGAGKSRHAESYVARGYVRLNRDERGGSLRDISDALDDALASGDRRLVLDNTYLTRASRSRVLEAAARHRIAVRCIWVETPLAQAQVNLIIRLLDRQGSLPAPEGLRRLGRREPGILTPTRQMRSLRELEPPSGDEGFSSIERIPFERDGPAPPLGKNGMAGAVFVAAAALAHPGWEKAIAHGDPDSMHLLFDWRPGATVNVLDDEVRRLSAHASASVERALCPHAAGPPECWCRPPLPGLILEFARSHNVDLSCSVLIGVSPAHRTLAATLGLRHVAVV